MRSRLVSPLFTIACAAAATACSSSTVLQPTQSPNSDPSTTVIEGAPSQAVDDPNVPNTDAPEISRSRGEQGGIVILFPRISGKNKGDAEAKDLARTVQGRLRALAATAAGDAKIEMRPEPERSCPKPGGCNATSVGALVSKKGDSCIVVALVSKPGESPQTLVPWVGKMRLKQAQAPFREPPENQLMVDDFIPCTSVVDALSSKEKDVTTAIKDAM